jgi:hypothetical protein
MENSSIVAITQKVKNAPVSASKSEIALLIKTLYDASAPVSANRDFHSIASLIYQALDIFNTYTFDSKETNTTKE